ncbi:MAG: putative aromatic amino acid aminotransferase [Puniceicoccaceae bacterium 5H]|nr:MAG: putative aromatic amino acid aminotransferase [Puniceicoccaceae bacterium 5H]
MPHFAAISVAPPDPILGLTEAFKADPNPNKINFGVGVYLDDKGRNTTLQVVKAAEQRLWEAEPSKNYLPIAGDAQYGELTRQLLTEGVSVPPGQASLQTPGGTGALRVVADFLAHNLDRPTVWMPGPTWPNHPKVFNTAGLPTKTYRYFDSAHNSLDFEGMLADLQNVPQGDVVLLHGCCHNPTGIDPTPAQWQQIAQVLKDRDLLGIVDIAYQGFGDGLHEDAVAVRTLLEAHVELLVCQSFSKNFGLYNERVGALHLFSSEGDSAHRALSQLKVIVRTNYSNPPAHGALVVRTILADDQLRQQWQQELAGMRARINGIRSQFAEALNAAGVGRDFSFLTRQRGMFSLTGLNLEQVDRLRREDGLYMVGNGRINVAGLTPSNLPIAVKAIARVLS